MSSYWTPGHTLMRCKGCRSSDPNFPGALCEVPDPLALKYAINEMKGPYCRVCDWMDIVTEPRLRAELFIPRED